MKNVPTYRAHPWHGVAIGADAPNTVTCYVEIVPTDTLKFEIDKESGILKVDRPQKYSNHCPTLYGFIPQTLCGERAAQLSARALKKPSLRGDGDPLDICILTERPILHGDILVRARPVGGFRLIDRNEADDKIIAVLEDDDVYRDMHEARDLPAGILDRLRHYFLTYKAIPGSRTAPAVRVTDLYNRATAHAVIRASITDYKESFGSAAHTE